MSLTRDEVAAREAAALTVIEGKSAVTAAPGETAKPSEPAPAALPAEPPAPAAPTAGETDADPLGADAIRRRFCQASLQATLKESDFFDDVRDFVADLLLSRTELDKGGMPRLRSGEELLDLTAENVQEALGPAGSYLRKAKGVSGSGGRQPREISTTNNARRRRFNVTE